MNVACWHWSVVGPTLFSQRQPSANGPTISQSWANVVMPSGELRFCHSPALSLWRDNNGLHTQPVFSCNLSNLKDRYYSLNTYTWTCCIDSHLYMYVLTIVYNHLYNNMQINRKLICIWDQIYCILHVWCQGMTL